MMDAALELAHRLAGDAWVQLDGCIIIAVENSAFTDSRESTIMVKTPRIVPKGINMHSMQATTNTNQ